MKPIDFLANLSFSVVSCPLIFIDPEVGRIIVEIIRKVVVFPDPFGPIKAKTLLGAHLKVTESTAVNNFGRRSELPTIFLWSLVSVKTFVTADSSIIFQSDVVDKQLFSLES